MNELFTPPKYFKNVKFHRHTDRTISWLELFYDLVYVATFIQIGNFLSDNISIEGFAQFCVMTFVVWWAWTGETFYQNRFVADDLIHRLLVFTQMFAVATLGLSVSNAFGDLYVQFTLAYVVTRFTLVLMYVRLLQTNAEGRELSIGYMSGFSVGILFWLGSLLLPAEYHWIGWMLGIIFEFFVPLTPSMRAKQLKWTIDLHHISERFGIFTIILLGESFVKILDDAQGTSITMDTMLFSTFGLLIVYSLWWLYFSETAGNLLDFDDSWKPVMWIYGHLPLTAGLAMFGVGAKKLFGATVDYPDKVLNPDYRLLYTASIVIYLLALALIDYGLDDELTPQDQNRQAMIHVIAAIAVGAIGLLVTGATPILFVFLVSMVMLSQVFYDIYIVRQETETAH